MDAKENVHGEEKQSLPSENPSSNQQGGKHEASENEDKVIRDPSSGESKEHLSSAVGGSQEGDSKDQRYNNDRRRRRSFSDQGRTPSPSRHHHHSYSSYPRRDSQQGGYHSSGSSNYGGSSSSSYSRDYPRRSRRSTSPRGGDNDDYRRRRPRSPPHSSSSSSAQHYQAPPQRHYHSRRSHSRSRSPPHHHHQGGYRNNYGSSSSRPPQHYNSPYSSNNNNSSSSRDYNNRSNYAPRGGYQQQPYHGHHRGSGGDHYRENRGHYQAREQAPPAVRYWFMLAFNEGDIEISQKENLWATKKRLRNLLNDNYMRGGTNILIFGVFGKLYVAGYATMGSRVGDEEANQIYPWIDVHSSRDKNFRCNWNAKTYVHYDVINAVHRLGEIHDATEISAEQGAEIIKIINQSFHPSSSSASTLIDPVAAVPSGVAPPAAVPSLPVAPVAAIGAPSMLPEHASAVLGAPASSASAAPSQHVSYERIVPPLQQHGGDISPTRKRGRSPSGGSSYSSIPQQHAIDSDYYQKRRRYENSGPYRGDDERRYSSNRHEGSPSGGASYHNSYRGGFNKYPSAQQGDASSSVPVQQATVPVPSSQNYYGANSGQQPPSDGSSSGGNNGGAYGGYNPSRRR